ncbi:MAG: YncE family protein, partial [Terracidiphilus sp.]
MRRFLTLVSLLCLAIPAGISISGCTRNPDANYCNGAGYGLKITDVDNILLQPATTGISLAYGQESQVPTPMATTCKGTAVTVNSYNYGTTNNQLVDISPTGKICAGTWNRNTGGGIPNYTICTPPSIPPTTGGLPYATAYITASTQSITSNPVEVFVHAQVTGVSLVTSPLSSSTQQCYSQNAQATLNAQACYGSQQYELCAPPTVASGDYACSGGLPPGVNSVPNCTAAIGTLTYAVGTPSIATITTNTATNQVLITAEQPGTTAITASVAGSGSSAGYFSTCPPKSISVTLANGSTSGTVAKGTTQSLITTVTDTNGNPVTGLDLSYQSTDPIDISANSNGTITTSFPGVASIYAVCQPPNCNPAPANEIGEYGTGLSISSNPVTVTTPGTASDYAWFAAPGQSRDVVSIDLISGAVGSTLRLPYVPNSMVMDRDGNNLYFGSAQELMIYSTSSGSITTQNVTYPGVVLAVSPDNSTVLINDQALDRFYLYNVSSGTATTYNGGLGNAAAWTPDSQTLYITDNAALNNPAEGITGHTDTLYVYNAGTGWTTYALPANSFANPSLPPGILPPETPPNPLPPNSAITSTVQTPAIVIPSVGAFLRGGSTVAHTWCPTGTVGDFASFAFYPQGTGNSVSTQSDALASTTDGKHILGAAVTSSGVLLSDIGVTLPKYNCLYQESDSGYAANYLLANGDLLPPALQLSTTLNSQYLDPAKVAATAIDQVVPSPKSNLAFITYTADESNTNAELPYYVPGSGGAAGTVGYIPLTGGSSISAPLAGAFTPDDQTFFVSTAGDNKVHEISIATLTDIGQISPSLPACTPGTDAGCTLVGNGSVVPATV